MPKNFKEVSTTQIAANEGLDQILQITTPRKWMVLFVFVLGFCGLVLWAFFGVVTTSLDGQAIILRGPLKAVQSKLPGQVEAVLVESGGWVSQNQPLLTWLQGDGGVQTLAAPFAGEVISVNVRRGDHFHEGRTLVLLSLSTRNSDRLAMVFLAPSSVSQVAPGMKVRLQPNHIPKEHFGQILGEVQRVEAMPMGREGLHAHLGLSGLVDMFQQLVPVAVVFVRLPPNRDTPSGLQWTSMMGSPGRITEGTLCKAEILIATQKPITLLSPVSQKRAGL